MKVVFPLPVGPGGRDSQDRWCFRTRTRDGARKLDHSLEPEQEIGPELEQGTGTKLGLETGQELGLELGPYLGLELQVV